MASELSACFVGLGSIGKRHLRNLHAVARERGLALAVDALRHAGGSPLDAETAALIRQEYASAEALGHYDLMFVCNPSQLHYETLCRLKDKADHFFIEKPFVTKPLTDTELAPFLDDRKFYVACPLRHTLAFSELEAFVTAHPVYAVRAICSSYLPDWRPGSDYRKLYSSTKDSGGVALDLIHEFDYLFALFGFPQSSRLIAKHVSHLEIESPDLVSYVADYPDKTVELHLDYFGRTPQRYCEVYSRNETVRFDFMSQREDRNESYLREMKHFVDFSFGKSPAVNSARFANTVVIAALKGDG